MDDKGFIFTADAALALIVVIVLTATVTAYTLLPYYQGEDHQHLETLADSVLETMEQSGQLRTDAVYYSSGNATLIAKANNDLNSTLGILVPSGIAYRITMNTGNSYVVSNTTGTRNLLTSNDIATKVKVISGPQEGWVGRAYYKLESVNFATVDQPTVTTVWNFHNVLGAFSPWSSGLDDHPYWAEGSSSSKPKNISFSVPSTTAITNAKFIINEATKYGITLNANGHSISNTSSPTGLPWSNYYIYKGDIDPSYLLSGNNNFYLKFNSASSSADMRGFALIASYITTLRIPQGVTTDFAYFPDIAGAASDTARFNYSLATNTPTTLSNTYTINWGTYQSRDFDLSTPFRLTGVSGALTDASAVGTVTDLYLPPGTRLLDSYVVVNSYGGADGAIVQVKTENGAWTTVFDSYDDQYTHDYTGNNFGYGNIPGIISLHDSYNISADYLRAGHNKIRIILYDAAMGGGNFDFVGLTNCYASISYTRLPIRWDTYSFNSYQNGSTSTTKSYTQQKQFKIDKDAQSALLFLGFGLDTRTVDVTISNGTASSQLYTGSPYVSYLDLAALDLSKSTHLITSGTNTNGNPILKNGTYTLTVTVHPSEEYESGDGYNSASSSIDADPELYSGTRIAVLYPKFLSSIWADSFASNPTDARINATNNLIDTLQSYGYTVDTSQIKTEAVYSGDVPNSIPVRLELWKQ